MARVKYTPSFESFNGSIGNLTFTTVRGVTTVREKPIPDLDPTFTSDIAKAAMRTLNQCWRGMNQGARDAYYYQMSEFEYPGITPSNWPLTVFNFFIRYNMFRLYCGLDPLTPFTGGRAAFPNNGLLSILPDGLDGVTTSNIANADDCYMLIYLSKGYLTSSEASTKPIRFIAYMPPSSDHINMASAYHQAWHSFLVDQLFYRVRTQLINNSIPSVAGLRDYTVQVSAV